MKRNFLSIGFLSLCFLLTSLAASAQCNSSFPNSHELENASDVTITYKAWVTDASSPCGTVYLITGTVNPCSAVCIIPNNSTDIVVAMEVTAGTEYYASGIACQITATNSSRPQPICPVGSGGYAPLKLTYNGATQGTVFEP